jgi:opacity protein-like surface antigen
MKAIAAAALAGIAMASTPSLAADLFGTAAPPMSFPAQESPTAEVGSNWYLRGDLGVSIDTATTFSLSPMSTPTPGIGVLPFASSVGSTSDRADFSGDIGVGFRFNNYLRGEATYEYRFGPSGSNDNTVICPQSLTPYPTNTGYEYITSQTCNGNIGLQQHNQTALASAYLDLGTYWGVTPYVGAGGGLNANTTSGSVAYTTNPGGASYSANLVPTTTIPLTPAVWVNPTTGAALSPQPKVGFTQQSWNRSFSSTKYTPAWALMAGVGIPLSPSATLDIGYRYLNAGVTTTLINSQTGSTVKQSNSSQEVRIGIRYIAD